MVFRAPLQRVGCAGALPREEAGSLPRSPGSSLAARSFIRSTHMSAPSAPPKARTFEPRFVQHGGARILRLEFSRLSGPEIAAAADQVRVFIAAEPRGSVRTLTIL